MTSPSLTLNALLPEIDWPVGWAEKKVSGLSLDSRAVAPGDLFFAVDGVQHKGRDFLPQAFSAGASLALVEADVLDISLSSAAGPHIGLPNLKAKMSEVAARFYGQPAKDMHIAGVTGTNGKTTCSQLLAGLYAALGERSGVLGTLGYGCVGGKMVDTGMTTPDAINMQRILRELADQRVRYVAMEVSSHSLAQGRVTSVPIRTAIFTNLTRDHLDYHGSFDAYGKAKLSLFSHLGLTNCVVNIDDPFSDKIINFVSPQVSVFTYSLKNSAADIFADSIQYLDGGIRAQLITPWGRGKLQVGLLGEFNLSNLLAVVATACIEGFTLREVLAAAESFKPVAGRMERVGLDSDVHVLLDYAHTPDALRAVLSAARVHCKGALWCVFGCGGDRDKGKRPEMATIAETLADICVVTSDNPRTEVPEQIISDILAGFDNAKRVVVQADRATAIALSIADASPGDMIVVAGKGHENYQIIGKQKLDFCDKQHATAALVKRNMVSS